MDSNENAAQTRFERLIQAHKGILYKVCRAYCPLPDERDDLAQDIVLQCWRSYASFDETRAKFSTWLYRIALNTAISQQRRAARRPREGPLLMDVAAAPAEPVEVRMLYDFIDKLDPLHRALLLLYLDGVSYAEIANVLGISESNAATKVGRLKVRMKEELT